MKFGKERGQRDERTHRSSVGRERIAHDIRIAGHDTLPSKAIQAISIDRPRDMWRINGFTSNRSPLLQFLTLRVMTNKEKREKKYKSLSIYLDSERRHEASKVELLVVQPLKELFGIGNNTPPRVVLSISHGV